MTHVGPPLEPTAGDVVVGAVPVDPGPADPAPADPGSAAAEPAVVWRVRRDERTLARCATRADGRLDGAPDVAWVRERADRKQRRRVLEGALPQDTRAASFAALRVQLWFEFVVAVTAYNEAVMADEIGVSFPEPGGLHLAKHFYPAGYLDVRLTREPPQFLVTVKLRRSAAAAVVEDVVEGAWTMRDGSPRLLWFGLETTARAVVQRVLTMFIDET
jgi:hypothetical protein